ncbi:haloacid dehalogenase [Flavobacterium album]|uniref:Haloacid dehalogenase n=1 Tax=Flavobacterium album TaxID=2175091 RepID=A0A2S1R139_9FLAO|nr:cation-translocating P-type ATPase [Flavobacterium album]AWH86388.1 haloacid dehalogenase [Flavobacterium album]
MALTNTFKGLSQDQVREARLAHGLNVLSGKSGHPFWRIFKGIVTEPMIILLLAASSIYLISGKFSDALLLFSAVLLVAVVSVVQEGRSHNAFKKLKEITQPQCTVIREGTEMLINTADLVPGDCLIAREGETVAADGEILQANDFSLNESVITGEAFPVEKDENGPDRLVYAGTAVTSGLSVIRITHTGNATRLGMIGDRLKQVVIERTPLERQIRAFVRNMAIIGTIVFLLVWAINFYQSGSFIKSLLKALTLAMSILPEEIPVAYTTFMALGAWRLMRSGIVVKQMKTVEALGSATVICVDKTGTITQNRMSLAKLALPDGTITDAGTATTLSVPAGQLLQIAMFASEPIPFDPMEKALHDAYSLFTDNDERSLYRMVREYPLSGQPPMMTHVYENASGHRLIAVKGAPEAVLRASGLTTSHQQKVREVLTALAAQGYRVLAVGSAADEILPEDQMALHLDYMGLVAFYDPPKENMAMVLKQFYDAGVQVKIITGDNSLTTEAIAKEVGFRGYDKAIGGEDLMRLSDEELSIAVRDNAIFSRMFPEAKLRIINALKANRQVVAMTGDGVNDAPALRAAHIGIAMGRKGTAIAKEAASLVLVEDDLSAMVTAIAAGRKIYANLKKAVQYIIAIHIPIILIVLLPLLLGWTYPAIFSPLHVIVLELIMGPTCSVAFEGDPLEKNTMHAAPRPVEASFFSWGELAHSLLQGAAITAGLVLVYQVSVARGFTGEHTRTLVFTTLVLANILLTQVSRSRVYSILTVVRYKNPLIAYVLLATMAILAVTLVVPDVSSVFQFVPVPLSEVLWCLLVAASSVLWYEAVKYYRRRKL